MSVASEFPPEVHIPARARRASSVSRHLAVVPARPEVRGAEVTALFAVPAVISGRRSASPSRLCHDELDPGARAAQAPLRLTRRGVVALVAVTVAAAGLLLLVAHASLGLAPHDSATGNSAAGGMSASVVVQNGDTLWSIARRVRPASDPRQVVDELRRVNHLNSVTLSPGQTLKVG